MELLKVSLPAGYSLHYDEHAGWHVKDNYGRVRQFTVNGQEAVVNQLNTTVLGSDVANAEAVANTQTDVTGLSFPVVTGEVYWFEFNVWYTAAATTTGSRWSVNGPATTGLTYMTEYSLAATTTTRNANSISYNLVAASNATSSSTGSNMARMRGFICPSADGDVIARFASEVTVSAITAKAGSYVQWIRTL